MEGELMIDVLIFVFTGLILLVGWLVKDHHSEYPDTFCVPTALSIVWTERRLKEKYNRDGTLK